MEGPWGTGLGPKPAERFQKEMWEAIAQKSLDLDLREKNARKGLRDTGGGVTESSCIVWLSVGR